MSPLSTCERIKIDIHMRSAKPARVPDARRAVLGSHLNIKKNSPQTTIPVSIDYRPDGAQQWPRGAASGYLTRSMESQALWLA